MTTSCERLIVAPSGRSQAVFSIANNELTEITPLDAWSPDYVARATAGGWLACAEPQGSTLVAQLSGIGKLANEFRIEALPNVRVDVIEFANEILFGGGIEVIPQSNSGVEYGRQLPWIGWCDVARSRNWKTITLMPPASEFLNKGIDALAVSGSSLLAYDNIVEPLFVLVIEMPDNGGDPAHLSTRSLSIHNTYERIRDATSNDKFIATLSTGINHGVSGQYISVCDSSDLDNEICVFSEHSKMLGEYPGGSEWKQIALANSRVFIAAGQAGLGIGDITYEDGVAYSHKFGRVDRVAAFPDADNHIIVSTNSEGVWSSRVVPVPLDDLRENQQTLLRQAGSDCETTLSRLFDLRFGISRIDLLTDNTSFRNKYGTSKVAEVRKGQMVFPLPDGSRDLAEVGEYKAEVSIALMGAGLDVDVCAFDEPVINLAATDSATLERAVECVLRALTDDRGPPLTDPAKA